MLARWSIWPRNYNIRILEGEYMSEFLKLEDEQKQSLQIQENKQEGEIQKVDENLPLQVEEQKVSLKSRLADKFKAAHKQKVSLSKISQKERIQSVTTTKKKSFFSKPVSETKTYYKAEALAMKDRQAQAETITKAVYKLKDDQASFRMSCSLEEKAECGFENTKLLSRFGELCTKDTLKNYGKDEDAPGRAEVLDLLTSHMLDISMDKYKDLSDKKILENISSFESMSMEVESYNKLLKGNPKYVESLKGQKTEDGKSQYDVLMQKIDVLKAVSDYYRIRKLILTDSEYINNPENISGEIAENDCQATVRLKEMLRASYYLAERINKLSGEEPDEDQPKLTEGVSERTRYTNKKIDKIFSSTHTIDGETIEKPEGLIDAEISQFILEMETKSLSSSKFAERNGLSFKNPPNEVMSKSAMAYAFGTEEMKNMCIFEFMQENGQEFIKNRKEIQNNYFADKNEGDSFNAHLPGAKKYTTINGFDIMDNVARNTERLVYFSKEMGMTEQEAKEWYLNICLSKTKFYKEHKDDEKSMDYMEDAFADAAMESLIRHNAAMERLAEMVGQDIFLMHPADLMARITEEQFNVINMISTITNIIQSSDPTKKTGPALVEFVNNYRKRHPDSPSIDPIKFLKAGTAFSSVQFRMGVGQHLDEYLEGDYNDLYDKNRYAKAFEGNLSEDEVNDWLQENKERPEVKRLLKYRQINEKSNLIKKLGIYFYFNPEKVTADMLKVTGEAEMAGLTKPYEYSRSNDMLSAAEIGLIKPRTFAELKSYEKSLKSRNMTKTGYFEWRDGDTSEILTADPYNMCEQYKMIFLYVDGKKSRGEFVSKEEEKDAELAREEYTKRAEKLDRQLAKIHEKSDEEVEKRRKMNQASLEEDYKRRNASS